MKPAQITILQGDAMELLETLPADSVQCCVTSPPYWGLRDYGEARQIGLEETPEQYVETLTKLFRQIRRIIKPDGTVWLNLGDSYTGSGCGGLSRETSTLVRPSTKTLEANLNTRRAKAKKSFRRDRATTLSPSDFRTRGLPRKNLVGIPWRVAFALQADGWILRSDIIWHKPNPMPESTTDRPTRAHEYFFLLSKTENYFYDAPAIGEPIKSAARYERAIRNGEKFDPSKHKHGPASMHDAPMEILTRAAASLLKRGFTNKRTVWTIPTQPYGADHYATFPENLIKPAILAGTKPGDLVMDPFAGSGTTGKVAAELGRRALLIELNPDYVALCRNRCAITPGLAL